MAAKNLTQKPQRAMKVYRSRGLAGLLRLSAKRIKPLYRQAIGYGRYFLHRIIDKTRYGNSLADPYKTILVRPADIERMRVPNFYLSFSPFGTFIFSGSWDKAYSDEQIGFKFYESEKVGKIDNYRIYQSVKQWLEQDLDWEETWWHQTLVERAGFAAAAAKHEKLRSLVASIARDGYQSQRELKAHKPKRFTPWSVPPEHGEIVVDIGRDGEILFDDGTHRLCISKVLGIDEVPVRVLIRHKEWQNKRHEMHGAKSASDLSSTLLEYLHHPDMQDVRPPAKADMD